MLLKDISFIIPVFNRPDEINELLSLKQSDINDCGGIFLVLEEGCINKRNLKMVCNICGLNNQKIIGWIFLEKKEKTLIF